MCERKDAPLRSARHLHNCRLATAALSSGELISVDAGLLTIRTESGGSKLIILTDETVITKSMNIKLNNLEIGDVLMINGDSGTDGSIMTNNIQIRPKNFFPNTDNSSETTNN
ncbi:hypothetical protein KKE28_04625 [Patescibacteria group bacterium]|nr:hypothetical protein [Patescibacteria group bacterium]